VQSSDPDTQVRDDEGGDAADHTDIPADSVIDTESSSDGLGFTEDDSEYVGEPGDYEDGDWEDDEDFVFDTQIIEDDADNNEEFGTRIQSEKGKKIEVSRNKTSENILISLLTLQKLPKLQRGDFRHEIHKLRQMAIELGAFGASNKCKESELVPTSTMYVSF
jgi:hypothetical protein